MEKNGLENLGSSSKHKLEVDRALTPRVDHVEDELHLLKTEVSRLSMKVKDLQEALTRTNVTHFDRINKSIDALDACRGEFKGFQSRLYRIEYRLKETSKEEI
jgi:hypothetical protein